MYFKIVKKGPTREDSCTDTSYFMSRDGKDWIPTSTISVFPPILLGIAHSTKPELNQTFEFTVIE